MSRNRRKSRAPKQPTKQNRQQQPAPIARDFTDVEEEFFRAGSVEHHAAPVESFADLDEGYERRPSLFSRLFSRWQTA